MKYRNPIFVGGFPYVLVYIGFNAISAIGDTDDPKQLSTRAIVALIGGLLLMLIGAIYAIYWQVSTARDLRQHGGEIPNSIFVVVPIAQIWWDWKYSQAVEKVLKGKVQAPLGFVLIILLGFIGMAILQNFYNKAELNQKKATS